MYNIVGIYIYIYVYMYMSTQYLNQNAPHILRYIARYDVQGVICLPSGNVDEAKYC